MSHCGDAVGVFAFLMLFLIGGAAVVFYTIAAIVRAVRVAWTREKVEPLPRARVRR